MTREEAIEILKANYPDACFEQLRDAVDAAISALKRVERKKGKWDDIGGIIRWGCPICHHAYETKYNFCPNCGADMNPWERREE